MTKGRFAITAIQWLATLGVALLLPAAHATTAIVFSESTGRYGVTWNEPNKKEAIEVATDYCRKMGGGKDCKPLRVTDELGFGAVANTCAGNFCGISVITGRRSAAQAERDAIKDCNSYYGTNNCVVLDNWQETGAAAPVTKAPPPTSAPQAKPVASTARPPEAPAPSPASETHKGNALDYDKACGSRDAESCFDLALMYAKGNGVRQDKQKAAQLYDKACNLNIANGCFNLALMYDDGNGIRQDHKKAENYFEKACGMNQSKACFILGDSFFDLQDKRGAQYIDKACELGYALSCNSLGMRYIHGTGVRQDKKKALQLFDRSCSLDAEDCKSIKKVRDDLVKDQPSLNNKQESNIAPSPSPGQKQAVTENTTPRKTVSSANSSKTYSSLDEKKAIVAITLGHHRWGDDGLPVIDKGEQASVFYCSYGHIQSISESEARKCAEKKCRSKFPGENQCKTTKVLMESISENTRQECEYILAWVGPPGNNNHIQYYVCGKNQREAYIAASKSDLPIEKGKKVIELINPFMSTEFVGKLLLHEVEDEAAGGTIDVIKAENGDARHQLYLFLYYDVLGKGSDLKKKNWLINEDRSLRDLAHEWLKKSAANGNADAQFILGSNRKAAAQGHKGALSRLKYCEKVENRRSVGCEE